MARARHLGLLALPSVALCLVDSPSSAVEEADAEQPWSWPNSRERGDVQPGDDSKLTADTFMRTLWSRLERSDTCLPELDSQDFAFPTNGLPKQLAQGGRVFFVGDSVIGQICQLGSPGLCCSAARPCKGPAPFPGSSSTQERQLDLEGRYAGEGWQHLFEFRLRDAGDQAAQNTAYFVAPEVHDEPDTVNASVELVTRFLEEKKTTREDVLVLGMIGTHYNHGLSVFQSFVDTLLKKVANPFPGRVVLLGYSPQHFAGAGHYDSSGAKKCAPSPLPSDVDMPRNAFRSAIFLRSVWAHLTHRHARLVDLNEMLSPLWSCHRSPGDCTHWKDPVVSMQAQLILDALQRIVNS